ncbi:ESCRT-II complex, vps25 subunit, partial [Viridothelium virens]
SPAPSMATAPTTAPSSSSSTAAISAQTPTTTFTATSSSPSTFPFPPHHTFPPFFTLQPNSSTRRTQLQLWTALILAYCRHTRTFRLAPIDAQDWPLFHNATLRRRLALRDIREVLSFMASTEGGGRAEWVSDAGKKAECWVYWRRPEEWAGLLEGWVDATGQRGAVLTLYELVEGDACRGQEWAGMDVELLQKCLQVLVKKGKAGIFGEEQPGVKFF